MQEAYILYIILGVEGLFLIPYFFFAGYRYFVKASSMYEDVKYNYVSVDRILFYIKVGGIFIIFFTILMTFIASLSYQKSQEGYKMLENANYWVMGITFGVINFAVNILILTTDIFFFFSLYHFKATDDKISVIPFGELKDVDEYKNKELSLKNKIKLSILNAFGYIALPITTKILLFLPLIISLLPSLILFMLVIGIEYMIFKPRYNFINRVKRYKIYTQLLSEYPNNSDPLKNLYEYKLINIRDIIGHSTILSIRNNTDCKTKYYLIEENKATEIDLDKQHKTKYAKIKTCIIYPFN